MLPTGAAGLSPTSSCPRLWSPSEHGNGTSKPVRIAVACVTGDGNVTGICCGVCAPVMLGKGADVLTTCMDHAPLSLPWRVRVDMRFVRRMLCQLSNGNDRSALLGDEPRFVLKHVGSQRDRADEVLSVRQTARIERRSLAQLGAALVEPREGSRGAGAVQHGGAQNSRSLAAGGPNQGNLRSAPRGRSREFDDVLGPTSRDAR